MEKLFLKIHSVWTEFGLQISSIWLQDLVDKCFTIWTSPSNTCVLVPWPFRLLHQYRSPYRGEGSRCLFSHLFLVIYSLFLSNILLLLFMSFTNNNISNNILVVSITLSFSVQSQLRDLNVGGSAIVRLYPTQPNACLKEKLCLPRALRLTHKSSFCAGHVNHVSHFVCLEVSFQRCKGN